MKFFKRFPLTWDKEARVITNITKKILVSNKLRDTSVLYYKYKVQDGERLDSICHKLYSDESYQWVLVLINNWLDPRGDLPLTSDEFNSYLISKYGSVQIAQTTPHHYEDSDGEWVDAETTPNVVVYCDQWEERQNESKREITVVRREYIDEFNSELKRIMKEYQ